MADPLQRDSLSKALRYMDLEGGKPLLGHPVNVVFIGSCTNSRISDLRCGGVAAEGPQSEPERARDGGAGSQQVKRQAEAEGLPEIFRAAGCEWREPGCSMCIAMNGDQLQPGEYSVSTSNRNFEGRQGKGGRTFLASPLTAAAAALTGVVTDVRTLLMKPFTIRSRLVPLPMNNVDTDQIIPARFLKTISKQGLDEQLFYDWRYDAQGNPKPDFILNQPRAKGAQILLAGDNFGCGSSREHAPWALTQFGFRAVISTSFADIFKQNSLKNALLPIVVPADVHAALFALVDSDPDTEVTVDLATQTVALPDGRNVEFPIDPFSRHCLLEGVDELGYILKNEAAIAAYEAGRVGSIDTLA